MTLLGYFNSLRELGGSRRIVEDEVNTRLTGYAARRRVGQAEGSFANRSIAYEVVELTSRVNTAKVAEAKRKLALPFHESDKVDVAIATNMISVGLDITRLGLMVVNGQPKTCAEYIQATSRVGRDVEKPGLIVTLLNIHRPPRPVALRAVRRVPRVVLPERRGHERDAVLAPGPRPGPGGDPGRAGAPRPRADDDAEGGVRDPSANGPASTSLRMCSRTGPAPTRWSRRLGPKPSDNASSTGQRTCSTNGSTSPTISGTNRWSCNTSEKSGRPSRCSGISSTGTQRPAAEAPEIPGEPLDARRRAERERLDEDP